MARNNLILAAEYNNIQSLIAQVLGTGTGDYGYGQRLNSRQVLSKTNIKAAQWQALRTDILRARVHQIGDETLLDPTEINSLTSPSNAIQVNEDDRAEYLILTQQCITDRFLCAATQGTREKIVDDQVKDPGQTGWNGQIIQDVVVNFNSRDDARFFFNAGGRIEFSAAMTGININEAGTKNNTWFSIFNSMGTIRFDRTKVEPTGNGQSTNFGWENLTVNPVFIFNSAPLQGPYTDNQYAIAARVNAEKTKIFFQIYFKDQSQGGIDENVTATLTSIIECFRPSGPNVSLAKPTATTTGLPGGAPVPPPPAPFGAITVAPQSLVVNEGDDIVYTVNTINVPSGTILYWTTETDPVNSTANGADFSDGALSGQFVVSNNTGTIIRNIAPDRTTEGPEKVVLKVRTGGIAGPVAAIARTVTISDTSLYVAPPPVVPPPPPPAATYSVEANTTILDEGATVGFTVRTTNFAGVLYWSLTGGVSAEDISPSGINGPLPITNNLAFKSITIASDALTEGAESFIFNVHTGSVTGPIVASTSSSIVIRDTSKTPSGNASFTTPGSASFTVPANVTSLNFQIVGGGGGGGGRDSNPGYAGYPGHILDGRITVAPNDVIQIGVGGGGKAGRDDSAGGAGGIGGVNGDWAGGQGGAAGPSGVSGSGGGGGGASYIVLPDGKLIVAGGGGGGGGGGNNSAGQAQDTFKSNGSTKGGRGGDKNGGWYDAPNDGSWSDFMKTYAIWTGSSQAVTTNNFAIELYAPDDGNYSFIYASDNVLTWDLSGTNATTVNSNFQTSSTKLITLTKNTRYTLNISIQNTGGPAGVAFQVKRPNGTELWSTLSYSTGPTGSDGGGGGGGGGGYLAGAGGYKVAGDNGGKSGSDGQDFDSGLNFTKTTSNNGGVRGVRGQQAAGDGGNGSVTITWGG